jgi:hypothetical protein
VAVLASWAAGQRAAACWSAGRGRGAGAWGLAAAAPPRSLDGGARLGLGAWPPRRRLGAWTGTAAVPRARVAVGRWVLGSWPPPPGKAGTRTTGTLGVAAAVGSGVGGRDGWEGKGVENLES